MSPLQHLIILNIHFLLCLFIVSSSCTSTISCCHIQSFPSGSSYHNVPFNLPLPAFRVLFCLPILVLGSSHICVALKLGNPLSNKKEWEPFHILIPKSQLEESGFACLCACPDNGVWNVCEIKRPLNGCLLSHNGDILAEESALIRLTGATIVTPTRINPAVSSNTQRCRGKIKRDLKTILDNNIIEMCKHNRFHHGLADGRSVIRPTLLDNWAYMQWRCRYAWMPGANTLEVSWFDFRPAPPKKNPPHT